MKTEKMTCLLASTTHICDIQGQREEFLKIMEDSVAYTKVEVRMARYVIPSCTMYIRLRPQQPKCTQIYGTNFYNVHI